LGWWSNLTNSIIFQGGRSTSNELSKCSQHCLLGSLFLSAMSSLRFWGRQNWGPRTHLPKSWKKHVFQTSFQEEQLIKPTFFIIFLYHHFPDISWYFQIINYKKAGAIRLGPWRWTWVSLCPVGLTSIPWSRSSLSWTPKVWRCGVCGLMGWWIRPTTLIDWYGWGDWWGQTHQDRTEGVTHHMYIISGLIMCNPGYIWL